MLNMIWDVNIYLLIDFICVLVYIGTLFSYGALILVWSKNN